MSTTDYSDWPRKGDKRPQPWETDDSGVTPRHGLPLLVSGGAVGDNPAGRELFAALHELGYPTPISEGRNPYGVIGAEELAAVAQFRRDYGVRENPEPFGGDNSFGQAIADSHLGPYTGEAILRAVAAQDKPGKTRDELAELRERVGALELAAATSAPAAADAEPAGKTKK
jgi:hypothetical protein